jgi:alkanesulfonate monooxygenase SsuD/methylene tetrahydromethanopterin reductase-like flavin-dependent oxidoreductase (luciferase family)
VLKMSTSTDLRGFAIFVDIDGAGAHPASWRVSGAQPAELVSARCVAASVRAAERAGFTAVTFDDHPLPAQNVDGPTARIDAGIRAAFSAPLTSAIGLVPVVHALYNEPFHVATQLASLDTASHGRAGWIVAGDADAAIAARHGREPLAGGPEGPGDVDAELVDVVEAVRRVWDTWEDDAVIRDTATGRYFDRDRVHYADFEGRSFAVKGPALLPRSPQGQVLVVGEVGTRAEVDVALLDSSGATLAAVGEAAAAARAQHGPDVRLLLQLEVALDRAGRTAAARLAELDAWSPWAPTRQARYVGDAAGLDDLLTALADVVDGVRILPAVLDADLDELGRAVLPALRASGVFRSPEVGATLRHTLGLPRPANRFARRSEPDRASTGAAR